LVDVVVAVGVQSVQFFYQVGFVEFPREKVRYFSVGQIPALVDVYDVKQAVDAFDIFVIVDLVADTREFDKVNHFV